MCCEEPFARVDVLPATDRVYIFRHGAEEKSVDVSGQLTERYLPIEFWGPPRSRRRLRTGMWLLVAAAAAALALLLYSGSLM